MFHWVSQQDKKRWKHEAAGRAVLLFQFRVFGNSMKLGAFTICMEKPVVPVGKQIEGLSQRKISGKK